MKVVLVHSGLKDNYNRPRVAIIETDTLEPIQSDLSRTLVTTNEELAGVRAILRAQGYFDVYSFQSTATEKLTVFVHERQGSAEWLNELRRRAASAGVPDAGLSDAERREIEEVLKIAPYAFPGGSPAPWEGGPDGAHLAKLRHHRDLLQRAIAALKQELEEARKPAPGQPDLAKIARAKQVEIESLQADKERLQAALQLETTGHAQACQKIAQLSADLADQIRRAGAAQQDRDRVVAERAAYCVEAEQLRSRCAYLEKCQAETDAWLTRRPIPLPRTEMNELEDQHAVLMVKEAGHGWIDNCRCALGTKWRELGGNQ